MTTMTSDEQEKDNLRKKFLEWCDNNNISCQLALGFDSRSYTFVLENVRTQGSSYIRRSGYSLNEALDSLIDFMSTTSNLSVETKQWQKITFSAEN